MFHTNMSLSWLPGADGNTANHFTPRVLNLASFSWVDAGARQTRTADLPRFRCSRSRRRSRRDRRLAMRSPSYHTNHSVSIRHWDFLFRHFGSHRPSHELLNRECHCRQYLIRRHKQLETGEPRRHGNQRGVF